MAATKVEYDIETPWTVTRNNWIGPTADTSIRPNSALPHSAARSNGTPDFDTINVTADANTIYMDPFDGSDSNSGTSINLDAVKTFAAAETLITGTRQHIHIEIFDTGTHGFASTFSELDLDSISPPNQIPLDTNLRTIQVASGQTCKGTFTYANLWSYYSINAALAIHGLEVDQPLDETAIFWLRANAGSTLTVDYCKIASSIACFLVVGVAVTLNRSIFQSFATVSAMIDVGGSDTLVMNNCILMPRVGAVSGVIGVDPSNYTLDLTHNLYLGLAEVYRITPAVPLITNNHSHIIQNCTRYQPTTTLSHTLITNSLINLAVPIHVDANDSTNVENRDPLFIDEVAGIAGDPTGFQLAHVGRTSGGFNYPINSPAVDLGLSDAGAWDYTYTEGAEAVNTFTLDAEDGYSIASPMQRVNYQSFSDILGASRNTWDGVNWVVDFKFDGKYFFGSDLSYEFLRLFRSKTFKRYYPYGASGLFGSMLAVTNPATDQIDFGSNLPVRTLPDATTMPGSDATRPDTYKGWVVKVSWTDSGSKTGWFEITTHTGTTFTLLNIRGDVDFNTGSARTANIEYLPVICAMKALPLASEYVSENETNGIIKPFYPQGLVSQDETQSPEWHLRKFRFEQTRED